MYIFKCIEVLAALRCFRSVMQPYRSTSSELFLTRRRIAPAGTSEPVVFTAVLVFLILALFTSHHYRKAVAIRGATPSIDGARQTSPVDDGTFQESKAQSNPVEANGQSKEWLEAIA